MELTRVPCTDSIEEFIDYGHYDGHALCPLWCTQCPTCQGEAFIVKSYNGGWGRYYGLRCTNDHAHNIPVIPSDSEFTTFLVGQFNHNGWVYEIVPAEELTDAAA